MGGRCRLCTTGTYCTPERGTLVSMARVPLSAREQLLEARRLGHELSVVRRTFDSPDVPDKIKISCTCGYESTWRRSEKAAMGTLAWHLGKALGESDARESEMQRNGVTLRHNPAL